MSEAATEFLPILAAVEERRGALVVSLHDVAPATRSPCEQMLAELSRLGIRATSLLVVPDYHRNGSSMADAAFVRWLHAKEDEGHEVVLHGYYHQRDRHPGENLRQRLITRVYTQDEGEFFDLSYEEARARIQRGLDEMTASKFAPVGFIAPAWLLNSEGERAARDAGMEYTVRLQSVTDLRTGDHQTARSLVYSTRASWRRLASLAWNAVLARAVINASLVRLSLHPPDLTAPSVWRQAITLARRLAETRRTSTYRDWIAEERQRT